MTNTEVFDALQNIVGMARESMLEAIDALAFDAPTCDDASNALLEECVSHIDNIAMAAEIAEKSGLSGLCIEINEYLSESDFSRAHGQVLVEWASNVQAYLERPTDPSLAAKLLEPLPEQHRQGWLEVLLQSGPEAPFNSHLASDTTVMPAVLTEDGDKAADFPPEDDVPLWNEEAVECAELQASPEMMSEEDEPVDMGNGILGLVSGEIAEIEPQLLDLLQVIFAPAEEESKVSAAVTQYLEVLARIRVVSNDLELVGLRDVCDFVDNNMNCVAGVEPQQRKHIKGPFERWPALILDYLRTPTDDHVCLELINHLQNEIWPKPLSDDVVRELLESLTIMPAQSEFEEIEQRQMVAQPEDVALEISDAVSADLLSAFFQETPNHAASFSANMESISIGEDILENVESALRLTHTIKGSANLIGANGVANLAHHLEDILEYLAKKQVSPPAPLTYTLQESADCLETMIDALQGLDTAPQDSQRILQDVLDWANRIDQGRVDEDITDHHEEREEGVVPEIEANSSSQLAEDNSALEADQATRLPMPSIESLQVPTSSVDMLFKLAGETSIAFGRIQEHLKRLIQQGQHLREQDNIVQQRRFELENLVSVRNFAGLQRQMLRVSGSSEVFDSLELDQYDELYGTSHSFIESVADSRELSLQLQGEFSALEGLFSEQQVLNRELQQLVMAMRMVPVGKIFSRLQRCVRQACRATGKQAELNIQGSDLLLDSEVLDKLADPLMHLLRNAIDHGIEAGEEREGNGKPAVGKLTLCFAREGNHVLIRCIDDGRGLDYESIREKAVVNGLLNAEEAIDNSEIARLILVPGFSTRETATQISGRGVGMDVVHKAVTDLKGNINVGEGKESGCEIALRLPITLITSHTLIVKAAKEIYAIPTNFLEQILPPQSGSFTKLGNKLTYHLDNAVYPAKPLAELLNTAVQTDVSVDESQTVLLVRADTGLVAVLVDQVVSSIDLVVKGLGRFVKEIPGISGVATLGDGRVVPVLDFPQSLSESFGSSSLVTSSFIAAQPVEEVEKPFVLIVDDSLSVRKSLAELSADAGYETLMASNGLEAVELLRKHMPKIVLADLEMPKMNGLELTSHIRADERLSELPVIMITSRTQEKHRRRAEDVGVSAYFNKPYSADDLLATMDNLLSGGQRQ